MSKNILTLKDAVNPIDAFMKMADANPGAAIVLCEMMEKEDFLTLLFHLDDMGISGSKIWLGFKDYCKQDLDLFIDLVNNQDGGLQDFINNHRSNKS